MSWSRIACVVTAVSLPLLLAACLEQFDRSSFNKQYAADRVTTAGAAPKLTAAGEIPAATATVLTIEEQYKQFCASCHGEQGKGDGPAGAALTPHPRNFTDANWQTTSSDDRIASVIKNGGGPSGLSPIMAPWGGVLNDDQVKQMVALIRKFKG